MYTFYYVPHNIASPRLQRFFQYFYEITLRNTNRGRRSIRLCVFSSFRVVFFLFLFFYLFSCNRRQIEAANKRLKSCFPSAAQNTMMYQLPTMERRNSFVNVNLSNLPVEMYDNIL